MYVSYWNLRENPFQNVADTRFAYLSSQHQEGLARLLYLVEGKKLGGVLVGPYGVGKSMVLEMMAEKTNEQGASRFFQVDATPVGTLGVAQQILNYLGFREKVTDLASAMMALQTALNNDDNRSKHLAIAIDEAQFLREAQAFEFLHLLTNLRSPRKDGAHGETAVTLILAGHLDLLNMISSEPSFCQRMQLAWQLEPLNESQTVEYVHHRMRAAGGDIWAFEEEALREVHHASHGIPRQINNICDIALLLGCAAQAPKIGRELMQQAINEVNSPMLRGESFQGARA
jgi:general secretion pathway protein A